MGFSGPRRPSLSATIPISTVGADDAAAPSRRRDEPRILLAEAIEKGRLTD
jgi:hypothetical protein